MSSLWTFPVLRSPLHHSKLDFVSELICYSNGRSIFSAFELNCWCTTFLCLPNRFSHWLSWTTNHVKKVSVSFLFTLNKYSSVFMVSYNEPLLELMCILSEKCRKLSYHTSRIECTVEIWNPNVFRFGIVPISNGLDFELSSFQMAWPFKTGTVKIWFRKSLNFEGSDFRSAVLRSDLHIMY